MEGRIIYISQLPAGMIVDMPQNRLPLGELPSPNFAKLELGQTTPSATYVRHQLPSPRILLNI
ncbi:MAG: hypothetical protein A3A97_02315 [Candidatus Terrybacteria bacterium RIFCSPLOWO2_01_FULL_40_23]|uniref:Uncharacterized protein n=1 Tax=Candidatus Terrybacteria bacterium RIFCSPLOWO2_01_FULL_40_23 TaxID=1802366 RepID=A0A1G2PW46_9BACT|nr:MAG: hypothetical protein A3A97_02315 [Candidatus Terrybacteria bacterium RIFCSPLOWO2_01_FULL_40_23]